MCLAEGIRSVKGWFTPIMPDSISKIHIISCVFGNQLEMHKELCWHVQVDARSSRILVSDPPLNLARNREKMVEVMFEEFGFSQLMLQPQAVLALYSQGVTVFFLQHTPARSRAQHPGTCSRLDHHACTPVQPLQAHERWHIVRSTSDPPSQAWLANMSKPSV